MWGNRAEASRLQITGFGEPGAFKCLSATAGVAVQPVIDGSLRLWSSVNFAVSSLLSETSGSENRTRQWLLVRVDISVPPFVARASPHPHISTLKLTATSVPVAGAIAGATAAAAYLDARFHIRKDLHSIRNVKATERDFQRAGKPEPRNLELPGFISRA